MSLNENSKHQLKEKLLHDIRMLQNCVLLITVPSLVSYEDRNRTLKELKEALSKFEEIQDYLDK